MSFCFSALVGDTGMTTEAMHDGLEAKLSDEGVGCRYCCDETRLISQYVESCCRSVKMGASVGCLEWRMDKGEPFLHKASYVGEDSTDTRLSIHKFHRGAWRSYRGLLAVCIVFR